MAAVTGDGEPRRRAVLASSNEHKLRELATALAGWRLELLDAGSLPPETGDSYVENARAKARFGRERAEPDAVVLGEDSGLEVAALGGRPGVESARWAADEHVARLLAALRDTEERRARYVCELVALLPGGGELRGRGELDGRISEESSGSEGFGFDPLFVPDGEERTVAELGNAWKAEHSHRARAARALAAALGG